MQTYVCVWWPYVFSVHARSFHASHVSSVIVSSVGFVEAYGQPMGGRAAEVVEGTPRGCVLKVGFSDKHFAAICERKADPPGAFLGRAGDGSRATSLRFPGRAKCLRAFKGLFPGRMELVGCGGLPL